jgi:hypothetical protein
MKKYFNISLVEVENHIVRKIVFVTTFFYHYNVFSPMLTFIWQNQILLDFFVYYVIGPIILLHVVIQSVWGARFAISFGDFHLS